MIRVAIVDDHPVVAGGISRLLDGVSDMEVVGVADDGDGALDLVERTAPDVVLMDLAMPGVGGVEATRQLTMHCPTVRVVIVASRAEGDDVLDAVDAGAIGFLMKDAEPDVLTGAIRSAAAGGSPLDAFAATALVRDRAGRQAQVTLSERELEVLQLVAEGLLNKQIARALGIREKTVKAHLGRAYQRIGVTGRREAVAWARDRGLIAPGTAPGLDAGS